MSDRATFVVSDDHVGVVTLNRADKLNALDHAMFQALHDVTAQARAAIEEGGVRAVLVRAEGRAFCSGLDVSLLAQSGRSSGSNGLPPGRIGDPPSADAAQQVGEGLGEEGIAWLQQSFTGLEDLPVPVVAAVQGATFGGGIQLALAAHLRLAAPNAQLALLEARWALIPDLGALARLPRLIGLSRAADMAMTARVIDAQTALAWGLVDAVLAEEDFQGAARAYAARLAAGPTTALGAIPALLRQSFTAPRDEVLSAERAQQRHCLASADFVEAATAAMQGRPPVFTGR